MSSPEKKKNIIYFRGIDTYGIKTEVDRWKKQFRKTQDDLNIDTLRIEEVKNWGDAEGEMLTIGLFATKRLFCISGGWQAKSETFSKKTTTKAPSKKEQKGSESEERLIKICESLPDDHFVIFHELSLSPKKSTLIAWLEEHADIRTFDTLWVTSIWESRFPKVDTARIEEVLAAYKKAESGRDTVRDTVSDAIANSLEKLELLSLSRTTTPEDSTNSILTESSGRMFDLSDSIMRGDASESLKIFHTIIESMDSHAFVPQLAGILRGNVYTKTLKNVGKSENEIAKLIPVNPYVFQKAYRATISYEKLRDFYGKILSINVAYRSGKGMHDAELWRIFSIELAIMGLKK